MDNRFGTGLDGAEARTNQQTAVKLALYEGATAIGTDDNMNPNGHVR